METIIAAIIGIIGVFFTAFVTVYVAKKQSYGNNVSKERAIWLQHFREEIADIRAGFYTLHSFCSVDEASSKRLEILAKAEGARCSLISRLRSYPTKGNEYNHELKEILQKCDFNDKNYDKVKEQIELFEKYSNLILEREWDKVKEEQKVKFDWKIIIILVGILLLIASLVHVFCLFVDYESYSNAFHSSYSNKTLFIVTIILISIEIIVLTINLILYLAGGKKMNKNELLNNIAMELISNANKKEVYVKKLTIDIEKKKIIFSLEKENVSEEIKNGKENSN